MLLANSPDKSFEIINEKMLEALAQTKKVYGQPIGLKTFVISDSILIASRAVIS